LNKKSLTLMILLAFVILHTAPVNPTNSAQKGTQESRHPLDPSRHFMPENETYTPDHTVILGWCSKNTGEYLLQVDTSPDFGSPELETYTVDAHFKPKDPLPDGTYYWRVKAPK